MIRRGMLHYNLPMRAVIIEKGGTPAAANVRLVDDWPEPSPRSGYAVIRAEASALNHRDLYVARGLPGRQLSYPVVTGTDGAGVVEAVGDGVDPAWVGRRVVVNGAIPVPYPVSPDVPPAAPDRLMIGEHEPGTLAEKFAAPVSNLLDVGSIDATHAAAFGLTHLTAWRMLISRANLRPGQTVLITGIGGGVALACLNIAKHFAATTIVTSRHQWKLDKAAELGAGFTVLDGGEDWSRQVRELTGKRGADICADSIGKAVHGSCIKSLARGGVFVSCGATSGADAVTDLTRLYWNQLAILGCTMGDMTEFREVLSLLTSGAITPVIDRVVDAAEAPEAFRRLESGEQFGKIVLRW